MLIRSISGLRGKVGASTPGLSAEVVSRYATSFATWLADTRVKNGNTIAIGYDGRLGGDVFYQIAIEAVRTAGMDAMELGMVPTPTVQLAAEHADGVLGGIAITASHNPGEWNGMKFLDGTGLFLDAEQNLELWKIIDGGTARTVGAEKFGSRVSGEAIVERHLEMVLNIPFISIEKIRAKKLRVVLDAVNASGSFIHPTLLRRLGVSEIIEIACDGSGIFPHMPEPVPHHLTRLSEAVREHKADVGIAVDPDADRLVLIMDNGEPFVEENTIVLSAEQVLKHSEPGQLVIVNLSTTRAVEDIAQRYNARVVRTPVGEINVSKRMKELGSIIGGEGSGGVILPAVHLGRDSLVGVALALGAMAEFDGSISEKRKEMPQYEIVKSKIDLKSQEQVTLILDNLREIFGSQSTSMNADDGLRIDFERSWLHARSSNTEPIIRLISEAPTRAEAEAILLEAQKALG